MPGIVLGPGWARQATHHVLGCYTLWAAVIVVGHECHTSIEHVDIASRVYAVSKFNRANLRPTTWKANNMHGYHESRTLNPRSSFPF